MADDRNHELPDDVFDEVKTDRIHEENDGVILH